MQDCLQDSSVAEMKPSSCGPYWSQGLSSGSHMIWSVSEEKFYHCLAEI